MNEQFLEQMRTLIDKCVEHTDALPRPLSHPMFFLNAIALALQNGKIELNIDSGIDFLETIYERDPCSVFDEDFDMEKILGTEIIKTAAELHSQIKDQTA